MVRFSKLAMIAFMGANASYVFAQEEEAAPPAPAPEDEGAPPPPPPPPAVEEEAPPPPPPVEEAAPPPPEPVKTEAELKAEQLERERRMSEDEKKEAVRAKNDKLVESAWYGNIQGITEALAQGADINARWSHHEYHGYTAVMAIFNQMRSNWKEVSDFLISKGADYKKSPSEVSMLTYAVSWNNTEAWTYAKTKLGGIKGAGPVCGGGHWNVCNPGQYQYEFCKEAYAAGACTEDALGEARGHPDWASFAPRVGIPVKAKGHDEL